MLSNVSAERAVLAGICRYGNDAYLDVADIVRPSTFTIDSNQYIFSCLKHILKDEDRQVDIPSIYSAANELGYINHFNQSSESKHLKAIFDFPVNLSNVRKFAGKISKLEVGRLMSNQLKEVIGDINEITGEESLSHILGIAENAIFDFSTLFNDRENEPKLLTEGLVEHLKYLADNPVQQVGIATGFNNYDRAIGGGLRDASINLIGARTKVGKSMLAAMMAWFIVNSGIPVLYMDTEMSDDEQITRMMAGVTRTQIFDIETGQFGINDVKRKKILDSALEIENKKLPYYHISIAGTPFEEQLSIMRRWIVKHVGLNPDGTAKPCVIIYDYIKLMNSDNISNDLKEYQILGFMMTALHNFSVRYKLPFLAFTQLNKDGITRDGTDVVSGSDRLSWLCSNLTILKLKSEEEVAEDGVQNGNCKLVPIIARHGPGMDFNDYINCKKEGWCSRIEELGTKYQLIQRQNEPERFEVEVEEGEDIPFGAGDN